MEKVSKKEVYEKPEVEVLEFKISESIAVSAQDGSGALFTEDIFGDQD